MKNSNHQSIKRNRYLASYDYYVGVCNRQFTLTEILDSLDYGMTPKSAIRDIMKSRYSNY